ncbi:oxidoreductase domain protein [Candidatus Vecturithrix granuli]|uniref:Oxidoreductase domain protein n=1 Tax=Vecturithrix granuli TaxID=1499967 RepID=A0A081C7W3_VECG1|nr:oxidoreductase domain protein [Candidatus Vecturithrix granuli]
MSTLSSIAVIGGGHWGKHLIRNFQQIGVLKLICEKNEDLLCQFAEQYPDMETCLALNDALAHEEIQGVAIATPAETHYLIAREALLTGKHVYVEKPLVLNEAEAEELIKIANDKKLVLMVGHLLQYHPVFTHLKELALSGELGRINYIYSNRLNLGKIRREENILWSFAPHDISMILALAGEEPESVLTTGGNYLHQKIADVTTTHLEFPSGLKAHIFVSWLHPFKEQKLVVVGDRKMAVFDDMQPWKDKLLLYPHEIHWNNNLPVPARAEPERIAIPQEEPLRAECRHFLDCISQGKRPLTDGEEGLRVLKILNASQRSLDSQGRKILLKDESTQQARPSQAKPDYFVHETSLIDQNVSIGKGTKIWHFSHVLSGSTIGERCNIGQNVVIGPDVTIGRQCKIQNNVSVYKGVTLEDGVFCGPSMVFTNIINPRAELVKMDELRQTLLKKGASVGANATIVCGVTLGRYCFVGAGAVVIRDVPDYAVVVGNPARQIGWMCACGERLDETLRCAVCGKTYQHGSHGLEEYSCAR